MALMVNGERIEDHVIEQEAESLRQRFQQMPPEQREAHGFDPVEMEKHWWAWSRENVIERTLLQQEARKDSEPIPAEMIDKAVKEIKEREGDKVQFQRAYPSEEDLRKEIELRIRLDRLIGRISEKVAPPKGKEVAEAYRKNRERFQVPETVHAAHIIKHVDEKTSDEEALAVVKEAEQELHQGRRFEELADQYSDCPGNGGDLGEFPRGQMVDEFDQVVFSLEPNQTSPIFRTPFGFHIAKLYEKKPARTRSLQEVRDEIGQELHQRKQTRAVEQYVDRLKESADIRDVASAAEVVGRR